MFLRGRTVPSAAVTTRARSFPCLGDLVGQVEGVDAGVVSLHVDPEGAHQRTEQVSKGL
jgi:hypothetical protein